MNDEVQTARTAIFVGGPLDGQKRKIGRGGVCTILHQEVFHVENVVFEWTEEWGMTRWFERIEYMRRSANGGRTFLPAVNGEVYYDFIGFWGDPKKGKFFVLNDNEHDHVFKPITWQEIPELVEAYKELETTDEKDSMAG